MTTAPQGKKAHAILNENHGFFQGEEIYFVEMDSEVNVNEEYDKYFIFKNDEGLIQTLTEDEFNWA